MRRHATRLFFAIGPDGLLTAVAIVSLGAVAGVLGGKFQLGLDGLAPLVMLGVLLALTAVVRLPLLLDRRPGDRRRFFEQQVLAARSWAPFFLVYVSYRALRGTMDYVIRGGVEWKLKALDEALLGVSPSWWMEKIASPWLTELMTYGYSLMFVLPLLVLVLLYARERMAGFREVALAVLAAFYLGLVLYLIVPAKSPRLVYEYATKLHGALGFYEISELAWDRLNRVTYDAFPSLHTCISSIALVYAWRHGAALSRRRPRLLFWIYLPHVAVLQMSTLYLRQHYFVDLIGGWALAGFVLWLAPRMVRGWEALRARALVLGGAGQAA